MLMLILLMFLGWQLITSMDLPSTQQTTWPIAKERIESGQISRVELRRTTITLVEEPDGAERPKVTKIPRVHADDEGLIASLERGNVPYEAVDESGCESALTYMMLPATLLMLAMFWMLMVRRENGAPPGVAAFGKSSAKLAPEEGTGVAFGDVAGIDEAIAELEEIVHFLKTPQKFTALGGKIPKGVLLVGPPGTGKTLLARAVAGEAGVPFFSISGSNFVEMFVGVGAARVRDLFQKAAEHAPCIIFIDELDAVGKARGGAGPVGGQDEREQTLNQILVEMDGFDGRKGIIIVAATNRPEILDTALLRAGRFDRRVVVDRPDVRGREAILQVHARQVKLSEAVDLGAVARMTPGFAGADLANVLNEAALLAARQDKTVIELSDIDAAVERSVAGLERKSRRLSPKVKRVVAFHESGHAICAAASPGADPVQKISIIPRGIGALGYTLQTPLEDRYLHSEQDLLNRIVTLYGGRVAEEQVFGREHRTTGASDDIRKASALARRMIAELGMSDAMGAIHYGGDQPNPFGIGGANRDVAVSEDTARMLDEEVRALLETSKKTAQRILLENDDLLHRMADHLLQHETLERAALHKFLAQTLVDGELVSLPVAPEPILPESPGKDFAAALEAAEAPASDTDGATTPSGDAALSPESDADAGSAAAPATEDDTEEEDTQS
jgi:cell division protease FtsH